jgi:hypothetical protein
MDFVLTGTLSRRESRCLPNKGLTRIGADICSFEFETASGVYTKLRCCSRRRPDRGLRAEPLPARDGAEPPGTGERWPTPAQGGSTRSKVKPLFEVSHIFANPLDAFVICRQGVLAEDGSIFVPSIASSPEEHLRSSNPIPSIE